MNASCVYIGRKSFKATATDLPEEFGGGNGDGVGVGVLSSPFDGAKTKNTISKIAATIKMTMGTAKMRIRYPQPLFWKRLSSSNGYTSFRWGDGSGLLPRRGLFGLDISSRRISLSSIPITEGGPVFISFIGVNSITEGGPSR
ncbi:MAG: hypothetical protein GW890_09225 [Vibrio sp.]|nr:hypothetical protein [Vibrio sp.]